MILEVLMNATLEHYVNKCVYPPIKYHATQCNEDLTVQMNE